MTSTSSLDTPRVRGMTWLAGTAPEPAAVLRAWESGTVAAIKPRPDTWRVVEAPLYPAIDAMTVLRPTGNLGPVLGGADDRLAWWLVAAGTAPLLHDLPGVVVRSAGWTLDCPAPGVGAGGRTWLHPPYGSGLLTPARLLREALLDAQAMAR
ncbi:hypothetical protein [Streptomyces sp. SPB074]|uniref:hypothetical protein n=1 Tax=Streptomyces sp. (strain SPB074) TaxID=465543 RepID=UPI0001D1DB56|nr:hypothetical protein [Streptomyces sp. SPB074]EDY42601.2 hypothetical protein SSBG_00563 [Streptomyces sp. SPB074]